MAEIGVGELEKVDDSPEIGRDDDPIHEKYKLKDMRDHLISQITDAKKKYGDWRRANIEPIWELIYDVVNGIPPTDNSPYQVRYANREVFRQLESLKPMLAGLMFPDDGEHFRYEAIKDNDENKALKATALVKKHLTNHNLDVELIKWLDEVVHYGTSYLHYGWQEFEVNQWKISQVGSRKDEWDRDSEEVIRSAPHLEWLNPYSVYTDPEIEDPRNSPYFMIERKVSTAYLKTMIRSGAYDANAVKKLVKGKKVSTFVETYYDNPRFNVEQLLDLLSLEEFTELRVYTNDGWEYTIVGGELVQAGRNMFGRAPVLTLRNYPTPGEHYGKSEAEILLGANKQLHDITSMWIDSIHLGLQPMMKIKKSEMNNWRQVQMAPGGEVYLDDLDGVEPLQMAPKVFELGSVREDVRRDMQLSTGMTDEVTGAGSAQKTATGIVRLQNAASARIEHKVRHFVPVFRELYRILYNLEAAFLSREDKVRMVGLEGELIRTPVLPTDFSPSIDVLVEVSPQLVSKELQQSKWQILWQMIGQDPRFVHEPIAEKMMQSFGIKNPKRVWASPFNTQRNLLKEIEEHKQTGNMGPAYPNDDHQIAIQMLSMYVQSPEFQAMDQISQSFVTARLQQHVAILNTMMGSAGQASQLGSPGGGEEVIPGTENTSNGQFDSRLAGANQQGAGGAAIDSGSIV